MKKLFTVKRVIILSSCLYFFTRLHYKNVLIAGHTPLPQIIAEILWSWCMVMHILTTSCCSKRFITVTKGERPVHVPPKGVLFFHELKQCKQRRDQFSEVSLRL